MKSARKGLVPLVAVTVLSVGACLAVILADFTPNLGLDLQGGVSVVLQPVKGGKKQTKVSAEALEQTLRVIETRVNAIGVGEPDITIQGSTIVVQLPGIKDQKRVLDLVGKTAELRFRPVLEAPTAAPPKDAKQQIADLRQELKIPDGVTVKQILDEENAAANASTTTTPADPTATTVPGATTVPASATSAPATSASPASTTVPSTTVASGAGTGGKSSAKGGFSRRFATTTTVATTTTAAPTTTVAPATTVPAVTTTTVYKSVNQWGVDVTSKNFQKLYQLDQLVTAAETSVTKPEDDKADATVTLLGQPAEDGTQAKYKLGPTLLTGRAIETASAGVQNGKWTVNPTFRDGKDGIDLFNKAAALCNSGNALCPPTAPGDTGQVGALAVVLDGQVISAPAINAATFQRDQIQISGSFTEQSAKDLALALRYGSLPLELEPQTVQTVSATLGSGALRSGIIAGLIGLGVVVLYIIGYYRLLGAITVGSLLLTAAILWAVVGALGHYSGLALSLAGIVGIIVSIGVSLDSSVVYFENLKEDVVHGRTLRTAVDRSFDQAWGTIIKADVSSLIGAVILYVLSVGPVKGFAFYLALSTIIDLVLAYLFIRPAVLLAAKSKLGRRPALFGIPVEATAPVAGAGLSGKESGRPSARPSSAGGEV
ncbi:MAG: protein translocase subunit SecD [Acidimicrobiales bacterium]